jgi:NTP pyrophosphatase (non-canonical NTP hydrolase)
VGSNPTAQRVIHVYGVMAALKKRIAKMVDRVGIYFIHHYMSNQQEHRDMVAALVKSGAKIKEELTASDCNALHMAVGIVGEAGELIDAVKKATIYRKPLDRVNVIEELGDLEFYMEGLRSEYGITREETLEANLNKLLKGDRARYAEGSYSDEQAKDRADKK